MDIRQLRYFLAMVDHGTMHRAARELFVAQPSVSQTLRGLERDLGTALFHRAGRRLVLTPAGEQLVEPARQVIKALELARSEVEAVDGLRTGRLSLAAMPSQAVSPLPRIVSSFTRRYPLVQISVLASDTPARIEEQLRTAEAELGLVAFPGAVPSLDGITIRPIEDQRFIVVAAPDSDLPEGGPLAPADLAGHGLIVGQQGTGMRRAADQVLSSAAGSRAIIELEHREAAIPLVLAGVGTAILSDSWLHLAESVGAAVRQLEYDEELRVCWMYQTGQLSPAAEAFIAGSAHLTDTDPTDG